MFTCRFAACGPVSDTRLAGVVTGAAAATFGRDANGAGGYDDGDGDMPV
jgi:hypothetical protein